MSQAGRAKYPKTPGADALQRAAKGSLPTAALMRRVKAGALDVCFDEVRAVWPPSAATFDMIGRAPLVALAALVTLCPQVQPFRLAKCLALDPMAGPQALMHARTLPSWPARGVRRLVRQIEGVAA